MKKILAPALMALALASCAIPDSPMDGEARHTLNWPVQKLYGEAKSELDSGNYERAIRLYSLVQSRYPYGAYAEQALMDQAYALYRHEEPEQALEAIAQFEKRYPKSQNLDYILYLKSLVLFNDDTSLINKIQRQDWSERDPEANRKTYDVLKDLVERYPDSRYAEAAREKMNRIVTSLAGNEMAVARYYMERGAWLAAVNRAKTVIEQYGQTPHVEEALALMMSAYLKMGENKLSLDAKRVLQMNYPNSGYLATGWVRERDPWYGFWSSSVKPKRR